MGTLGLEEGTHVGAVCDNCTAPNRVIGCGRVVRPREPLKPEESEYMRSYNWRCGTCGHAFVDEVITIVPASSTEAVREDKPDAE